MIGPSTILLKRHVFLLIFLLPVFGSTPGHAQDPNLDEQIRIEILEAQYKHFYGEEKLDALIDLSGYYIDVSSRKSIRYAKQAVILAEEIFLEDGRHVKPDPSNYLLNSYLHLGKAFYTDNKYIDAKETFDQANKLAESLNYLPGISESSFYLKKIDSLAASGQDLKRGFLSQTFKSLELKETVIKTTLDININTKINAAESHLKQYQYEEAISDYEDAINLLKNKGDENHINLINDKILEIRKLMSVDEEVIKNYNKAIGEQERIVSELALTPINENVDTVIKKYDIPIEITQPAEVDIENLELRSDSLNALANEYLGKKDYGRAEAYRLLHQQVENEIKKRENAETQLTLLRQQKQLAELELNTKNMELEGQRKARWNFIAGIGMLIALAITLFMLYITKQRDHQKLSLAYSILEETKSKLLVAEGNVRKLLRQQVSEDIAKVLVTEGAELTTKKSFVCIMFLDIRGFTPWAEKHTPEEIIAYQNKIFGLMIDIVNEFKGNINQFLGDGFMATFGAPKSTGNDCQHAFDAAMKIIKKLNDDSSDPDIKRTKVGIGLHAGNVVTGNVGTELRKQYSITGNTVILASRIEQLNKDFNSQLIISKEVYDKLEHFNGEVVFQKVTIKGRKIPIEVLTVA